ncbi:acyl-CoA dehydrogenase family protein [Streptomyces sp. NPDC006691]|uniref:acyl-CoA dehydrogenase family protein n=1 Tax=Streptomyces sp. NPDC006691 TaxID=3364757 RepID=UPI0036A7E29A
MTDSVSAAGTVIKSAEALQKARALRPLLRAHASDCEAARRLTEPVVTALTEAGMFRLWLPGRYGGTQAGARTLVEVVAALAEGDGSAAWVTSHIAVGTWLAAQFPEPARSELLAHPNVRITGVLAPTAQARPVPGGWRVTGRWPYNSGGPISTHVMLGSLLADDTGRTTSQAACAIPVEDIVFEDTWHVLGMRGTASSTATATDLFVPEGKVVPMHELVGPLDQDAGAPLMPFLLLAILSPQLGMGRAALAHVLAHAPDKPVPGTFYDTQAESVAFQLHVAEAAVKIETAEALALRIADELDVATENATLLSFADRARTRALVSRAVTEVVDAVTLLATAHGAGGFADSSPFQRIWRNVNMAARHMNASPAVAHETYGKSLLGRPERAARTV